MTTVKYPMYSWSMDEELVGAAEVAQMLGVSRQRAHQITQTAADFPSAQAELAAGRIWRRRDVEEWISVHPAKRKRGPKPGSMTQRVKPSKAQLPSESVAAMPSHSGHLIAAMGRLSDELRSAVVATSAVTHAGTKGTMREDAIRTLLRPYIPRRFEISSGEVVNADGRVSRQQDLIVTDAFGSAPLFAAGQIGIHPVESVFACLEIKSWADSTSVPDAVDCLASVKRLASDAPRPFSQISGASIAFGETTAKPFTGLVALSLKGGSEAVVRSYLKANRIIEPSNRCDAFVVLEKFICLWTTAQDVVEVPELAVQMKQIDAGTRSLLSFYSWLCHRLATYPAPVLALLPYLNASAQPHQAFRYPLDADDLAQKAVSLEGEIRRQ
jgi:predicted DNA-binding transcriptional regulator AlpA